jgi:hypothetical protein
VVAIGLVLGLAAAATAGTPERTVEVAGQVSSLSMDGPRIGWGVRPDLSGCDRAVVWDIRTGRRIQITGRQTCVERTSTGSAVELVLAGTRAAWTVGIGGNTESSELLFAGSALARDEHLVGRSFRRGDVMGAMTGTRIFGLTGNGRYPVYNSASAQPGDVGALRKVVGTSTSLVAHGRVLEAVAADGLRIAVLRRDGSVDLRTMGGADLGVLATEPARAVAIDGSATAVLRRDRVIALFHDTTQVAEWPLTSNGAISSFDVAAGFAVYAVGRTLHAVDLKTGRDIAVARASRAIVAAAIEPTGVAYAVNGGSRAWVHFLPLARLRTLAN